MFPYLFKIGGFELRVYSLMYIVALFLGIYIAKHDDIAISKGIRKKSDIEDMGYIAIFSGLVGARIYYVLLNWSYYSNNPYDIIAVWKGGLAIHGGIIGGIIGLFIYSKIKKYEFLNITDLVVGPLILAQAIGRIGNLANGEVHGVPTFTPLKIIFSGNFSQWWQEYLSMSVIEKSKFHDLVPWGIVFPSGTPAGDEFPNLALHPAMLYESILNLIAFIFIWFIFRKRSYKTGVLSMIYLISYGIIRYIVSMFRAEDLYFLGIKAPYIISIIMIIFGIIGIVYLNKKEK